MKMFRYKIKNLFFLSLFSLFLLSSCSVDDVAPEFSSPNQPILDEFGRTLILHGWNTSSSAKSHPERQPWIIESDIEREATVFGNNFVRYLIFWDGVEPERGVYDEAYLDKVEERVNWYTSRGMYVLLDMHQDLYSIAFGGDGAPEWALQTNGHPIEANIGGPWWLSNLNPAVIACWNNFWGYSDHTYLQDHYIAMWQKVVERFKDNPYVLGYDLMNEPWGGDLIKAFITGDFERNQLTAFYERLIPAIRAIDNDGYIFFEPAPAPVTFGAQSNLKEIKDTRIGESRIVYAPHCYPTDLHEGLGYRRV
ncbi:MAG: cellulase family glycosylhydrolase [Chitinophagales bacterium]